MGTSWQQGYEWSRQFLPQVKSICGRFLIGEAPTEEDTQRNTDLIVLRLDAIRIGCRIRSASYIEQYGDEFTIRESLSSGTKTELVKIIEGWGDYFFYAFADEQDDRLAAWLLGDLHVFRSWIFEQTRINGGRLPGNSFTNGDGRSTLRAFAIADLPSAFIIGQKPAPPKPQRTLLIHGERYPLPF